MEEKESVRKSEDFSLLTLSLSVCLCVCVCVVCRCVNHYIFSEDDCKLANGTFYYPSESEEECLRYSYCWSPQSIVTGLLSAPDGVTGRCSEGETEESLFEWEEAEWIGGTWADSEWAERRSVQANEIRMTIDFPLLQSSVSYSSDLSMVTSLQNQV